jgi:hypothetical protein
MISKHVDIWAVLLLLFGFALFTRTNETAIRIARARMGFYQKIRPVEVRVVPFRLNRFTKIPVRTLPKSCRIT